MKAGRPKQYLDVLGKPLLQHTLDKLCAEPALAGIVVAIAADDRQFAKLNHGWRIPVTTVTGGAERCQSVLACLRRLAATEPRSSWVLVHDAARPCVRSEDIRRLIAAACGHAVGGILAIPVRDTMKRGDAQMQVVETVDRTGLWHALTPQVFRLGALMQAIESALARGLLVTDEAQAMEATGASPLLVAGHADNIKVTEPDDWPLAEMHLRNQLEAETQCA